ncbi:MAG: diguanylate cyclase [Halioglobus sp.]|nr:diguanylate cyclase [Halioglobus sp.]
MSAPRAQHPRCRAVLHLLAGLCLVLAGQASMAHPGNQPFPTVVDPTGGPLNVTGQWRFHPGDDLAWAAPDYDDSDWAMAPGPERWPEAGFPEFGQMVWYRLTLRFESHQSNYRRRLEELGIRLGRVLNAYELYAGGQLLGGAGKLPPRAEVNYDRRRVFQIPPSAIAADDTLVLALRVWGGTDTALSVWNAGSYDGGFTLGSYRDLLHSDVLQNAPGLFASALFVAFGLYHLYLYRRNKQLDSYLWFGLLAINVAIYSLTLNQAKYALDWPFIVFKKIEYGAIHLLPALTLQMVWSLLREPIGRWLRIYQLSFVAASVLIVAIPGHDIHYRTVGWLELWTLPLMLVLTPGLVLRKAIQGNAEARTLLVGLLIFLVACGHDMLINLAHIRTERLLPYGFLAIMLAMAVSLANRFTNMLNRLEHEVQQRTAQLSEANALLARAASVDPLTGLLNRRGFLERAEAEIQRVSRSGRSFVVVLADIDNFKRFNDRHGHACGDHVLRCSAATLQEQVRDVDQVARWGGEEFILLLPETSLEGGAVLTEKLRATIADRQLSFEDKRLAITMTFGVASFHRGEALDACIARADAALYRGKEQGRNQVIVGSYKGLTLVN